MCLCRNSIWPLKCEPTPPRHNSICALFLSATRRRARVSLFSVSLSSHHVSTLLCGRIPRNANMTSFAASLSPSTNTCQQPRPLGRLRLLPRPSWAVLKQRSKYPTTTRDMYTREIDLIAVLFLFRLLCVYCRYNFLSPLLYL